MYDKMFEQRGLFNNSDLRNKVTAAVIIAAEGILAEATPGTAGKAWADKAVTSPEGEARRIYMAVLALNKGADLSNITGAADAAIQANVDTAIDLFIDADAGV